MNFKHYTYRVIWSQEDQEHVGLCVEFPSLSFLDKEPSVALSGIMRIVEESVNDMKKRGEKIPLAISNKKYSGQFCVRVPPMVHRNLAIQAAEQRVSMNRIVNLKLIK